MNVNNYFNALCYHNLVQQKLNNLEKTKKLNISLRNIRRFFKEIRKIKYNYYLIQYNVDQFGEENANDIIL